MRMLIQNITGRMLTFMYNGLSQKNQIGNIICGFKANNILTMYLYNLKWLLIFLSW